MCVPVPHEQQKWMYFLLEPNDLPNIRTPLKNRTSPKCYESYQCNYRVPADIHSLTAQGRVSGEGRVLTFMGGQYRITEAQLKPRGWTSLKCTGSPTTAVSVLAVTLPPLRSGLVLCALGLLSLSSSPSFYLFFLRWLSHLFFPCRQNRPLQRLPSDSQRGEAGR